MFTVFFLQEWGAWERFDVESYMITDVLFEDDSKLAVNQRWRGYVLSI